MTVLLFLFIYNPPISFFPMNSGVLIGAFSLVLMASYIFKKLMFREAIVVNKKIAKVVLYALGLSLYSLVISIVFGSLDFQVFKSYLSFVLFYFPGAFFLIYLMNRFYTPEEFIKNLIFVMVIQSVIIVLMLINASIKDLFFSLLRDGTARIEKNLASGGFRFLGFAYNSTWDLSVVQSIGVMLLAVLFKVDKNEINIKNVAYFILLCISIFLTARTGFLGIILGLLIILIPNNLREVPFMRITKFCGKIVLICVPLFFVILSLLPADTKEILEKNVLPWAFEMFQNDNNGKLETASSNELKEMYFAPSLKTFLIGDGYYVSPYDNTRYYMDTDAGYMRHILYYGIIGCLMVAVFYIMVFRQMFKSSIYVFNRTTVTIFILFLCGYFFVSHIKGDLFLGADMPIKLLILLYAFIMTRESMIKRTAS